MEKTDDEQGKDLVQRLGAGKCYGRNISRREIVVCWGLHNETARTGQLKQQRFALIVLEASSPRSRWWQVWPLLRPPSLACRHRRLRVPHGLPPMRLYPGLLFSYGHQMYWIRACADDLNYFTKGTTSKYSHIQRSWG